MTHSLTAAVCMTALLALALPAHAEQKSDMAALHAAVGNLQQTDPYTKLGGAVAACLSGQGDMNLTTGWFEENGWQRREEADMGIIELKPADTDQLYAWVADDGSFCRVWSEEVGTARARTLLDEIVKAAGLPVVKTTGETGCAGLTIAVDIVGYAAEITSSGNDPVCEDDKTSAFHFLRAEG